METLNHAIGWYAVALARLDPTNGMSALHNWDSNCWPRSVMMVDGTPKWEIQTCKNACAIASAARGESTVPKAPRPGQDGVYRG